MTQAARRPVPKRNLDDIISEINLNENVIHIGFIKTTNKDREEMNRAAPETDQIANVVQKESSSLAMFLFGWMSRRFMADIVVEYTRTLRFLHCEIALPLSSHGIAKYGSEYTMAIGVNSPDGVFIRERKFNEEYTWVAITCKPDSMRAIIHFAYRERGKIACVNRTTNIVLYPGPENRDKYTCPQLVMACLEFVPLPAFHFNPGNKLTVDELYDIVSNRENSPSKMVRLTPVLATSVMGADALKGPPYRPPSSLIQNLDHIV